MHFGDLGLIILVAAIAGAVFYAIGRATAPKGRDTEQLQHLLSKELNEQTQRLVENIGRVREESKLAIGEGMGKSEKSLSESLGKTQELLSDRLGKLIKETADIKNASTTMLEIGADIRKLSQILEGPKGRGGFGEFQLEQLLAQAVPADRFRLQHKIGDGTVDAAILMKDAVLCIDSKFPYANLVKYYEMAGPSPEKDKLLAMFFSDVKMRAKEIAKKYIVPPKTLDFAVMFIPAEAVFLEVVSNQTLHKELMDMKVVPASPNFLYVYFQALAIGFRGMAVEEQAKEILGTLAELKANFDKFQKGFAILGGHIKNASGQYAEAEKQSTKISQTLDNLRLGQTGGEPPPA